MCKNIDGGVFVVIGAVIKKKRMDAGITQNELHRRSGISQRNISFWESGCGCPKVEDCLRIARSLEISIGDFLRDLTLPEEEN